MSGSVSLIDGHIDEPSPCETCVVRKEIGARFGKKWYSGTECPFTCIEYERWEEGNNGRFCYGADDPGRGHTGLWNDEGVRSHGKAQMKGRDINWLALLLMVLVVALLFLLAIKLGGGKEETPAREEQGLPVALVQGEKPEDDVLPAANVILNCTVTHYCAERYEHICGNGDGLTAIGTEVVPYKTCAVDPGMIPLGSRVWVDYGDGVLHAYIAEDVGSAVIGGHIDLAVTTHEEADLCGVKTATVYWEER